MLPGFPAVIDDATHTLILGSFPGVASLTAQEYYAFPQNQFWRLLSAVLNTDLAGLAYQDRLQQVLSHGIGLWDVFEACARQGSLDSAIKHGKMNNFATLQSTYPGLKKLCFNGKTAGKLESNLQQLGYQTLQLPSSSPAYAQMSFAAKLTQWQQIVCKPE
ncbi:MAG: DNA-deoxyinosine glycosylase [Pseudomonadota bacterium]